MEGRFGESQEHKELKRKAKLFLEAMGCKQIELEKDWGSRSRDGGGYIVFDVYALYNDVPIVIECGGRL